MDLESDGDDLQSQVLQGTLQEVARRDEHATDCCVICLDAVSQPSEAQPCGHRDFDFGCIAHWLRKTPECPLCKARVSRVLHGEPLGSQRTSVGDLPGPKKPPEQAQAPHVSPRPPRIQMIPVGYQRYDPHRHPWETDLRRSRPRPAPSTQRSVPVQREEVYRHQRYSKHVGTNRLSRYRELTPRLFSSDAELVSRAKMFIRRELRVFPFLHGDAGGDAAPARRIDNAEFLLEYVVAILKSVDVMGSGGQAAGMLADFLGADNARLFLHELRGWLRSPYTKLEDWDRAVQYDDVPAYGEEPETSRGGSRDGFVSERYRERYTRKGDFYRPASASRGGASGSRNRTFRHEPWSGRAGGTRY